MRYPAPWTTDDEPLSETDMYRVVLELLHVACLSYLASVEVWQLWRHIRIYGHPIGYFADVGQLIDLACLFTQAWALRLYWQAYEKSMRMFSRMNRNLHYDALDNLMAFGRITRVNSEMASFQALLTDFTGTLSSPPLPLRPAPPRPRLASPRPASPHLAPSRLPFRYQYVEADADRVDQHLAPARRLPIAQ